MNTGGPGRGLRRRAQALLRDPGTTGLYLFAATLHGSRSLAVLGCLLMLYPLLRPGSEARRVLPRLALYHWLLLLAIYALLRAIAAMFASPGEAMVHGDDALRFVWWVGVLPVAWHLGGDPRRVLRVLAVALAGFVLARLWQIPGALWPLPAEPAQLRTGLGLEPIALGYYAGCALLGLLLFLPRLLRRADAARPRAVPVLLTGALLLFLAQCVLWSQSRGAWLSLLPCLAIALAWLLRHGATAPLGRLVAVAGLLALAVLLVANRDMLQQRLVDEQRTLQLLAQGRFDGIASGSDAGHNFSIGTRVNMLRAGLAAAARAPLFGSGPAAPRLLLAQHRDPILQRWNDFHNAPVDLLVRFGAVGLLLVTGGAVTTAAYAGGAAARRAYPADLRLFLALSLALLVLSSLSNFRLLNHDWRFWLFLVAGAAASPRLTALRQRA